MKKTIVLAVVFSAAVHTVFFAISPHIVLSGMTNLMDHTRKIFRIKEVDKKAEKVSLFSGNKKPESKVNMSKRMSMADLKFMKKMELALLSKDDVFLEKKKESLNKEKIKEKKVADLKREDILRTEEAAARKAAEPSKRSFAEKLTSENDVSGNRDVLKHDLSSNVSNSVNDFVMLAEEGSFNANPGGEGNDDLLTGSYSENYDKYEDIGKYIDILLSKYVDPDTGEKFFRLLIKIKDDVRLQVMPKEVLYLIDSSKSITQKKLSFMKSGLKRILTDFNEGDRFNLIAFRGDSVKFKPTSVEYTEENIAEAIKFIDELSAVGQTDVENALYDISAEPMTMYPSYLMLMSDGRPTTGIMDSRSIIQQITKENNKERPIFCFAGGSRINKYLLEFISYQNRAWSIFSSSTFDMENDFIKFYGQIKDPVLVDVRYFLVGTDREEVYPKYLSDFYHGKPLEIYGKYQDEQDFSMQILGKASEDTKEIIFSKNFKEAYEGGEEIARNWAFRKIYFLISQNTMGIGNPSRLKKEIEYLSRKYDITTPYDIKNGE